MEKRRPDFYLGDDEGDPPNWGGQPRECFVLGRPRLASGRRAWLVRVDPPLPGLKGGTLEEVVLGERSLTDDIGQLEHGWIQVNVGAAADPRVLRQETFQPHDLRIAYWALVVRSPEDLPKPIDDQARWRRDLARIRRFVGEHGHLRMPDGYTDDGGRLDVLVRVLRWHYAGGSTGSGGPYPGVDWVSDLEQIPGWEW